MGPNFLGCDRDQVLLLPPSLREWLPAGHLAWFVIDAVERLDLTAFYAAYRLDGQGRAAHEPSMMVALLLYSYAVGERSSRRIERRCVEDVATRVICANRAPDHVLGSLSLRASPETVSQTPAFNSEMRLAEWRPETLLGHEPSMLGPHVREHREDAPVVVRARGKAQLVEDHADVLLHGGLRDDQALADRLVRAPFGDQLEHLALAR
jgi:hypothetical protein